MNSTDGTPPEPGSESPQLGRDSRFDSFVRQAGPILAAARGVNETSLLKLRALANDLRLPKHLYERAISELTHRGASAHLTRSEQQFADFLDKELRRLPDKILSVQTEAKAVQIGAAKYQIADERARELVRYQASRLGLEWVAQSDAERYVESLCRELLRDVATPFDQRVVRLHEVGARWGLESAQCDNILRRVTESESDQVGRSSRRPIAWSFGLGLAAVAGALICILWFVVANPFASNERIVPLVETKPEQSTDSAVPPAAWWSGELYQRIVQLVESRPEFRADLLGAAHGDPAFRRQSYMKLVDRLGSSNELPVDPITRVIGWTIASEPEDKVIGLAIDELTRRLTPFDSQLAIRAESFDRASRSADVLLEVWVHSESPSVRARIEGVLFDAYDLVLDGGVETAELLDRLKAARNEAFWVYLIDRCGDKPRDSVALMRRLAEADPTNRTRRREAIIAILNVDPSIGTLFENELAEVIATDAPNDLLAWLEWTDAARSSELSRQIVRQIAERLQLKVDDLEPSQAVKTVRQTLMPPTLAEIALATRWTTVRDRAQALIFDVANEAVDEPRRVVNATHVATLALFLFFAERQSQPDYSTFDECLTTGPGDWPAIQRDIPSDALLYRQVAKPATAIERQQRDRALERIDDPALGPSAQLQAMISLAEVGDRFGDVSLADASIIVRLILSNENPDDAFELERSIQRIRHWPSLPLAFVDQIESANLSADTSFSLFTALFGEIPRIERRGSWQLELHSLALETLISRIDEALRSTSDGQSGQWWLAERFIRGQLEQRSRERSPSMHVVDELAEMQTPLVSRQMQVLQSVLGELGRAEQESTLRDAELIIHRFDDGLARTVLLEELIARALNSSQLGVRRSTGRRSASRSHLLAQRLWTAEVAIVEALLAGHPED